MARHSFAGRARATDIARAKEKKLAPSISYALNLGVAEEAGVTLSDTQGILVAVAPLIGTPRVVAACVGLAEGIGYVIALEESGAGSS